MATTHLNTRRGGGGRVAKGGIRGLLIKHPRELTAFTISVLICLQLYIYGDLFPFGFGGEDITQPISPGLENGQRKLSSANTISQCTYIDVDAMKEGLVCFEKCRPLNNNTLDGMGLDPNEKIRIVMPVSFQVADIRR